MKSIIYKFNRCSFGTKMRLFGPVTIHEGERYIVWDRSGKARELNGPARFFNTFKKIEKMILNVASPSQYLYISKKTGEEEFLKGPSYCFFNPIVHNLIEVCNSQKIEANEAIVIYRESENGKIEREIIVGPKEHYPQGKEWCHKFTWHGHDFHSQNVYRKIPGGLKFINLRLLPDQFYYDVENVRTKDDALITIRTMVFYHLVDINKLLDNSHDPIALFVNNISADIIEFMSSRTFDQFKKDTDVLNNLETYKQLIKHSNLIGFKIDKVIFKGYAANSKLEELHNEAIEKRTKLVLLKETEEENQKLEDYRLEKKLQREEALQKLEVDKAYHQENMKKISQNEELKKIKEINDINNANKFKEIEIEIDKLSKLKALGIDLTRFTIAEKQMNSKIILIEDKTSSKHIHLDIENKL